MKNYREAISSLPMSLLPFDFRGHHGVSGNIFHTRLGELVAADNFRSFHIDEIQSDLHQQGYSKGYGTEEGTPNEKGLEAIKKLEAEKAKLETEIEPLNEVITEKASGAEYRLDEYAGDVRSISFKIQSEQGFEKLW